MKCVRPPLLKTLTPVAFCNAPSRLVTPWSSSCFLVMTLTDWGISFGDSTNPVVERIADTV